MPWENAGLVLAQVQVPDQGLLSNLKWLRFPAATEASITMFFFMVMAIAVTIVLTLLVQGWLQRLLSKFPRHKKSRGSAVAERLDPDMKLVLERLKADAGTKQVEELLVDAEQFEQAVSRHVARAPLQEDLSGIGRLRRRIGLTAMNPLVEVVSTRQLLPDLTVRLVVAIDTEKLDLYCPILDVNERHMLIDVPYQKEYFDFLGQHPDVFLLYWRESDGETAFKVRLLPIHSGHISAFRCEHALRSDDTADRADFRLTVDLPATYQFVDLEGLLAHRQSGKDVAPVRGDGTVVDLSHGGAAFLADHSLSEHGFAQIHFTLQNHPFRAMLEVLTVTAEPNGKTLVRGKFRGLSPELGGMLHSFLSHEQFKRIQLHPALKLDVRTAGNPSPSDSESLAGSKASIPGTAADHSSSQTSPVEPPRSAPKPPGDH